MKSLRILSIGNSFAMDTMQHLGEIALDLGWDSIHLGILYIGGCSINRHYGNAQNDAPAYKYYVNRGDGWNDTAEVRISEAIKSENWDWISIQHGTGDGSRYTQEESYKNLPALVDYVRSLAAPDTKIAFNMAWVMEPYSTHPEITSYNGEQLRMYENLTALTERVILPLVDRVSPAGTAIQNARNTQLDGKLSRDGFHLSYGLGRYLAALTFYKALTGMPVDDVRWIPEEMTEQEREIAIRCANKAIDNPFRVTE